MNRDTLYSMAVAGTSKGAMISVPPVPSGRDACVYLVDNDHDCPSVIYDSGMHELPRGHPVPGKPGDVASVR